ncbi:pseudouridine synthase [Gorgonomyces haynaldii]|nr:pseudouridine synthase [Gorgonomyces haynaldii]
MRFTHWSREQLISYIQRLRTKEKQWHKRRLLNWNEYTRRPVVLRVLYNGRHFNGFASQREVRNTVEERITDALRLSGLIDTLETSFYSRSARTDTGVSATDSHLSLYLRSRLPPDPENHIYPWYQSPTAEELPYGIMINQYLPDDIKVLGWAPVHPAFDARYHCVRRTYHYYFDGHGLDIPTMQEATSYFEGHLNVTNICKPVQGKPKDFYERQIESCSITKIEDNDVDLYRLQVTAPSFVWHQIRAMMALLLRVGQGKPPSYIQQVLNSPEKPPYAYASPYPLVLVECKYPDALRWVANDGYRAHVKAFDQNRMLQSARDQLVLNRVSAQVSKTIFSHAR